MHAINALQHISVLPWLLFLVYDAPEDEDIYDIPDDLQNLIPK